MQIDLLKRMDSGGNWSQAEASANDTREIVIAWLVSAISVGCIIVFLIWFYRVRENLPALRINDARWSPGWAVGWWFVPIFMLFRPYQIAKEIWKASSLTAASNNWREAGTPSLLKIWWGLFILGTILYNASTRMLLHSLYAGKPNIDQLINASIMDTVATSIWIVATIPAILVVRNITRRQTERARFLESRPITSHIEPEVRASKSEFEPIAKEQFAKSAPQNVNGPHISINQTPVASNRAVDLSPETTGPRAPQVAQNDKECPRCAEIIKLNAKYCRFCKYEYSEVDFETEQKGFADELKEKKEHERQKLEEQKKTEEEAQLAARGKSYKGYTIQKTERGIFEVLELGMKIKGSKEYTSIEDAKRYINQISFD